MERGTLEWAARRRRFTAGHWNGTLSHSFVLSLSLSVLLVLLARSLTMPEYIRRTGRILKPSGIVHTSRANGSDEYFLFSTRSPSTIVNSLSAVLIVICDWMVGGWWREISHSWIDVTFASCDRRHTENIDIMRTNGLAHRNSWLVEETRQCL